MIATVRVSMFVHATEDETRLLDALKGLVPPDKITRVQLTGHFDNPIIDLRATLNGDEAEMLFQRICKELYKNRKEFLNRKEGNKIYLRLDKVGLLDGELTTGGDEGIHLEFRLR